MQDSEKVYRIELTNEEYEFLENLKNEFCNELSKMSNEEIIEYLKSFYPEQNLNFEKEINNTEKKTTDLTQFISKVKKYTEITELTPEILNELIEKILVHQAEKVNGKKVQEIDIYYRGIGIISFPVSLEDMTIVIEKMINKRISA